jgi:predicted short-subunit dehydrogenase-like oxidoreductase (DUF2520 family)
MGKVLKIDFIGAGNLAWNLAPALERGGASVRNIFSRNIENAKNLVNKVYEGQVKADLDFSASEADIILVAVSDDGIEEVAKELILAENVVIAHTSGSIPLSALGYSATSNIGVFYPLQTFTKSQQVDFDNIPFLIEGENKQTIKTLSSLASTLSKNVSVVSSYQRQQIHLAAVFASNFTNWMLTQSEKILEDANLDFSIVHALIAQSVNNAINTGPKNVQTGPAKRNDFEVLDTHMQILSNKPDVQNLYKIISQQILDHYQINE